MTFSDFLELVVFEARRRSVKDILANLDVIRPRVLKLWANIQDHAAERHQKLEAELKEYAQEKALELVLAIFEDKK